MRTSTRTTRPVLLTVPVVLALAATACGSPGSSKSGTSDTSGPVKIAVVDAQSGQLSSLGDWEAKGAKLAVQQWNDKGGINGRKIELTVFDDQGDPTTGTNIARKLASEHYIAMIGTSESAVTVAMAPILRQEKIPNITSGQSTALVDVKSPFLFLNGPTSTTYDSTLADYVIKTKGYKNIAMISNNGSYGKGEHDAFLAAAKERGATPVADQVVTTDQKDFSAALSSIRQKKPDLIFIGSEEVEAGLIVKQARDLGITAPFAGAAPQGTPVFVDTSGAGNADGTIVSSPYLSNDTDAASRSFAAAYKKAYGKEAELHGAKSFDGTNIVLTALKTSGVVSGEKLAEAIRATKYHGLVGDFAFDETGVGIFKTSIGVIKDGKLVAAQ
ncbi:ABC transporter substrate-binding protein [Streptomyces sp. CBMA29]|uniref:ABC transporter substrate-binding protein n=1 Tax=Streptomyces sp. CBMA29 TaxID=1896314 RepID=UPI001661B239|nr:ABC transporter substrate-binding protein [Streptomyces sp. CBMA29]MBD0735143.1 hypothetical protein [Streptomyces sp. CBMA29]